MSEPYLIAHLVRGEPAFDIAERVECPECHGMGQGYDSNSFDEPSFPACTECDGTGFWWIVSTSGHRAYPYAWHQLSLIKSILAPGLYDDPPPNWPDHYPTKQAKAESPSRPSDLLASLGLKPQAPTIKRRI